MEHAALSRLDALWDALTQVPVEEDEDDVVISEPFYTFRQVPASRQSGHGSKP
jgi:hypothetical protein